MPSRRVSRPIRRGAAVALLTMAAVMAAGCGASPTSPTSASGTSPSQAVGAATLPAVASTPGSTPVVSAPAAPSLAAADPAAVAAAAKVIETASLSDPATLDAVGAIRFDDGAADAAAAAIRGGATGGTRWAAVWVYASAGTDPAVLRPVLGDADPSLRAMAAAALVAWGDGAGLAVLRELAGSDDGLAGSYPPESVGHFVVGTLVRFVHGPGGTDAAAWSAWLASHGTGLVFDAASGTWSAQ